MLKKHLVVLLLLVMAVGASAQSIPSGTGRIEALGNSPYILDAATDISNNPVWTGYYRNYAFGDIGRNVISDFQLDGQYAGVSFGVSKKLSLGLILNKRNDMWNLFDNGTHFGADTSGIKQPIVPTTILIGWALSKDFHLGLAPYIAMWSNETVDGSFDDKGSGNSFGASLGAMKMVKKGWVEGVVNFRLNSFKRAVTDTGYTSTTKSEGGMELSAALRGWFYPKGSKIAIVPILGFNTYSWNPRYTTTGSIGSVDSVGTSYSYMGFNGGVGLNWPISDDIQIAGGVGAIYNTYKGTLGTSTDKWTNFMVPQFNFAGETRIADWLTGRFGYSRNVDMQKHETTTGSVTHSVSETLPSSDVETISLGAGFHFGRLSIDATVSEKWLKQGINFVSGQANDLFGVISMSYNFNTSK